MSNGAEGLPGAIALAAALGGALVAWHYHTLGLTLSHYDARGHLIVARRIADSITPGWQQVGAVWLPLPHLLNAIPVQVDLFYRSGASAVAISIASYAIATGAIAWMVVWLTESAPAALAGAAVFALNPNVLYLQSTPMTEPLLLATTTVAAAMLMRWADDARLKPRATSDRLARLKPRATRTELRAHVRRRARLQPSQFTGTTRTNTACRRPPRECAGARRPCRFPARWLPVRSVNATTPSRSPDRTR